MNLIKRHLSSFLTGICSTVLSLLGFSCSSDPGDTPLMYGMPTGYFEIKGAVTDQAGNDVPHAEIRVTYSDAPSGIYRFGETFTDSNGKYDINAHEYLQKIKIVCIPDDSNLQPDSVIVKMNYKAPDKHDPWYFGHAEETVDFKLKFKISEEE